MPNLAGLRSGLTLTLIPQTASPTVVPIRVALQSLSFTSVAPGGYGRFMARIALRDARLPHPELALFTQVQVREGAQTVWMGELSDPGLGIGTSGETVTIQALGAGNALKDDPQTLAYNNQTGAQIVADQFSRRGAYLRIDSDQSAVSFQNPANTYAPTYDNRTMEEVIADVAAKDGDNYWGVLAHPTHRNSQGFPTAQLQVHRRDTASIGYRATVGRGGEVVNLTQQPSLQRAFNVVTIGYNNGFNGYGTATYTDARLNADGSQGTAPFPRRVLTRDLSGVSTVTAAQAQSLANLAGSLYQNITTKTHAELRAVRSATGSALPLWMVTADANILLEDLATLGQQAPIGTAQAGVSLFYIVSATYTEDLHTQSLQLELDNFIDDFELEVARLQLESEVRGRGGKVAGVFQQAGAVDSGTTGVAWSYSTAGQPIGTGVSFHTTMVQPPTSITMVENASAGDYNASAVTINAITPKGFFWSVTCNFTAGNQWGRWSGTWQTNGNTIVALGAETIDWHCVACDARARKAHGCVGRVCQACYEQATHRGMQLAEHAHVEWGCSACGQAHRVLSGARQPCAADLRRELHPRHVAVGIQCPTCGLVEGFNAGLTEADEDESASLNYGQRAEHARAIRGLLRHPLVALLPPVPPAATTPEAKTP